GSLYFGCANYVDELYAPLTDPRLATTSSGTGGNDGGPPPECVPSQNASAVDDTCGVFVSSSLGDDANAGSKAAPLKTLGAALAKAKGRPVYACGESFMESGGVALAEDAVLYGGLDCAKEWVFDMTKKTQLTADADTIALRIDNTTTSAEVSDFAI